MKKRYNYLLLLFLLPFLGFSNGGEFAHSKQKNIKKTYYVNSNAEIKIDNSYGSITILTWDEDKIDIDIAIKVSGNSENWVSQRLNDIDVDITALKSQISATTVITQLNAKGNSNNKFEINYVVKIPKNGSVNLNNKYGNITMTDLLSSAIIHCKYGKITLGKLNSIDNNIQIEYCTNSSIESINSGIVTAKYSDLQIEKVNKLDLISDYTDTIIQDANSVNYTSKYGSIIIQNSKTLLGSGNYLKLKFGTITGLLQLETKYSDLSIGSLRANDTEINSSYTKMSIGFLQSFPFDFDVSVKYANFNSNGNLTVNSKEETNNTKKISGYNSKKGINKIKINSNYGNIALIQK
jgi:hypothetical protein